MMISCDKAATICDKSQYKEASWWQIFKLKLHILYCKACAKHSAKNTRFSSLCKEANLRAISKEEKEAMKLALKKEL